MNPSDSALDPGTSSYEDEFSDGFDPADAGDEMAAGDFAGDASIGDEDFTADSPEGNALEGADDLMATGDDDGFEGASWQAFESELADALAEEDGDEFLGRMLGGLSQVARRVVPMVQRGQRAARGGQLGSAAQGLARLLGSGAATGRGRLPAPAMGAGPGGGIAALLGQLMGQGFDEFEAFDEVADAYEDGVDEALPAIVGLAARGLARGLGHRNVGQLGHAARRALVRGVATAARTLVNRHGPRGARALGRVSQAAGRAARRGARTPQQAAQRAARGVPRVAERVAQQGGTVRKLARPLSPGRSPAARARGMRPHLGTAGPGAPREPRGTVSGDRVLRLRGPVEIVIRQR